ncbi:EAL domain-containing protein [Actinotalea sp. K2]|uniref:EAL domain-containing protein n=1 Tax=Actinotalea sp. K2 TaxID=2939438 RepID=UPI002017FC06|nr:EAL domain-containing protein [Actinotalea sp. K2]MCL3859644.1 EAL domain-containing protein [Actinotalea sp. K2]
MTDAPAGGAGNILVLTLHTGGHYYGEILAGVLRTAAVAGRHVVVAETRDPGGRHGDRSWGPAFSLPLAWDRVAGVVSIANSATPSYLAALRERRFPIVLASEVHEGFDGPVALPANKVAIEAAVQHLVDHGHTRIGFVGSLDIRDFRERYAAYQVAMTAHGLPVDDTLFFPTADFSRESGAAAARRLLAHPAPPTAIVSATDANAIGLIQALTTAGLRVPDDLAVLGFDNTEGGAYSTPSLSSVGQRFQDVGALAGRLIIDLVNGLDVPAGSYTPETVVMARRASCGCRSDLTGAARHGRQVAAPPTVHSPVDGLLAAARSQDERTILRSVARQVEALTLCPLPPTDEQLTEVVTALREVSRDAEEVQSIAADLAEHVIDGVGTVVPGEEVDPRTPGHGRMAATLWELQARGHRHGERRLDASSIELERIASSLLRSDGEHTRSLAWLAATHVRAGVLALWDGPPSAGRLRIAGLHDPDGLTGHRLGELVGVRQFPGEALAAASRSWDREMCVVLPVASHSRSWGLLALLGRVDTSSVREPYHQMTELLFRALESEELEDAVRTSGERYAWAARASNDGLWELDVVTGRLFLSARCRDLLGVGPEEEVTTEDWLGRVLPPDRELVAQALATTTRRPGVPTEIEYRLAPRTPDGRAVGARWVLSRGLGVPGPDQDAVRLVGSLADVTTRRELELRLRRAAMYDEVTGLANRRLFLESLSAAIRTNQRDRGRRFAVIFLDLDGFKLVNDSLGHLAGDDLLRAVASRMRSATRAGDTAARFGGDEFAVLLTDPVPDELLAVARRLQGLISRPVRLDGQEVSVTASVGIATSESGYLDAEDVLRDADTAMYQSKEAQRGTATIFDQTMHERVTDHLRSRTEIRTALAERQLVVHYQPIVGLDGSPVTAFEALVRWQHPERGLLLPGQFLHLVEDTDAIVTLGRWVTDEACRQIARWRDDGVGSAQVSVNVSNLEFWHEDLVPCLVETVARHGLPASSLVLEITESVLITDVERARRTMTDLGGLGFRLHVDDFGTGQSSLQTLQAFPVHALKIDGSFVRGLTGSDRSAVIVRAVVAMAGGLGMDVIAECVELPDQARMLREMGCAHGQGWLFARAMPGEEAGAFIGRRLDVTGVGGRP